MESRWVDSFDTFMEEIRKANCRKVHISMANGPRFERIDETHSIAHASTMVR